MHRRYPSDPALAAPTPDLATMAPRPYRPTAASTLSALTTLSLYASPSDPTSPVSSIAVSPSDEDDNPSVQGSLISLSPPISCPHGRDIRSFFRPSSAVFASPAVIVPHAPPLFVVVLERGTRFGGQLFGIHFVPIWDPLWLSAMTFLQSAHLEFLVTRHLVTARTALGNPRAIPLPASTLLGPTVFDIEEEEDSDHRSQFSIPLSASASFMAVLHFVAPLGSRMFTPSRALLVPAFGPLPPLQ